MNAMRCGRLNLSVELLLELLHLPKDTKIFGAGMDTERLGVVSLYVEHPDLKEVLPDNVIPIVDAMVKCGPENTGYRPEFVEWKQ